MLQTYLDVKEWDLSGFADLILGQPTVGTVVKIADDEDNGIFSVVSALNLHRYKVSICISSIQLSSSTFVSLYFAPRLAYDLLF